jgi:Domain of unknown function (DUF222)/HNH endonuclease
MSAAERYSKYLRDNAGVHAGTVEGGTVESTSQSIESEVAKLLASPASLQVLTRLSSIDPITLNYEGRVDYLAALEKQTGWLQALMQNAILAVAGAEPTRAESLWSGVDDAEREEVATALRLSSGTAQNRIDVARALTSRLSHTCEALANGEISVAHANVIARESATLINNGVSDEILREVEDRAIAHAEFHTPAQVANNLRTNIAKMAPEEFQAAAEEAKDTRSVILYPEANGMATLVAFLPAPDAQTIYLAIDKLARLKRAKAIEGNREIRRSRKPTSSTHSALGLNSTTTLDTVDSNRASVTNSTANSVDKNGATPNAASDVFSTDEGIFATHHLDLLRADSLTQLAAQYLSDGDQSFIEHGRPVTLNLTLDLPTLLGLAENPGQLSGYGPISADVARELAADAKWRRFITDPLTGNLLDYGRESYKPPQALVDFLMARDRTCRFPGCRQSAKRSDIDHAQAWDEGGRTDTSNLGVLCRRHHRLKTHGGWALKSFEDGSCEWISPAGKKYFVCARPIDEVA